MRTQAKKNVKEKAAENRRCYDKVRVATLPCVSIGSLVLLRRGQLATRMHGRLGYRCAGPFAVVSADVHTAAILGAGNKRQKVNRDNVKPYTARASPAPLLGLSPDGFPPSPPPGKYLTAQNKKKFSEKRLPFRSDFEPPAPKGGRRLLLERGRGSLRPPAPDVLRKCWIRGRPPPLRGPRSPHPP